MRYTIIRKLRVGYVTYAIVCTSCYPACWYAGPIHDDGAPRDNETGRFFRTQVLANVALEEELRQIATAKTQEMQAVKP